MAITGPTIAPILFDEELEFCEDWSLVGEAVADESVSTPLSKLLVDC